MTGSPTLEGGCIVDGEAARADADARSRDRPARPGDFRPEIVVRSAAGDDDGGRRRSGAPQDRVGRRISAIANTAEHHATLVDADSACDVVNTGGEQNGAAIPVGLHRQCARPDRWPPGCWRCYRRRRARESERPAPWAAAPRRLCSRHGCSPESGCRCRRRDKRVGQCCRTGPWRIARRRGRCGRRRRERRAREQGEGDPGRLTEARTGATSDSRARNSRAS